MKKAIYLLTLCLILVLSLSACIDPNEPNNEVTHPPHTHAFGEWETTKNPTCIAQGEKTRYCSCGEKQSDAVAEVDHAFTNEYDSNCNVCEFTREIDCDHTEVVTTPGKEATCTEDGLTEGMVCKHCEKVLQKQTVIFSPGHTEVIDTAVEPTCTTAGKTEGIHCSVCPEIIKPQGYVKALDHAEGDWIVKTEPTIDTEGYRYKECTRCYEKIAEENIPYLGAKGLDYEINADQTSCTVTGIGEFGGDVMIIPATIDGYKVTAIGERAFVSCNNLKSVELPEGVTTIGIFAFSHCEMLENITVPSSVSYIGKGAFNGCALLKSFVIPDGITTIYEFTFAGCMALESLYVPKSVTTFQRYATSAFDESTIYYEGSEEDWKKIDVSSDGNHGIDAAIHYEKLIYQNK